MNTNLFFVVACSIAFGYLVTLIAQGHATSLVWIALTITAIAIVLNYSIVESRMK